ncbi:MAG: DUF502 domain-containing protein [Pseudomonadota bacterium]
MTKPPTENPLAAPQRRRPGRLSGLRASFLTGLVVIAPIGLTIWLIWTVIGWVDGFVLPLVPDAYTPEAIVNRYFGDPDADPIKVNIRGVGVVFFLLFTVFVGWIAKGFIGRSFLRWAESLVEGVPVVRSVYAGLKQIAETVFTQSNEAKFDKACLVQYPRPGIWAIAFVSTPAKGEIDQKVPREERIISIFLPTTPNPTSGFLLFVPEHDVIYLDMGVEDAAKLVISAGLVYPADQVGKGAGQTSLQERMDA